MFWIVVNFQPSISVIDDDDDDYDWQYTDFGHCNGIIKIERHRKCPTAADTNGRPFPPTRIFLRCRFCGFKRQLDLVVPTYLRCAKIRWTSETTTSSTQIFFVREREGDHFDRCQFSANAGQFQLSPKPWIVSSILQPMFNKRVAKCQLGKARRMESVFLQRSTPTEPKSGMYHRSLPGRRTG